MDRLLAYLRIKSNRTVILSAGALTVLSVAAPVGSLAVLLSYLPFMPPTLYWGILGVAAAIPLIITPPIALLGLSILRFLTVTVDRIDDLIKFDPLTRLLSRGYFLAEVRMQLRDGGVFLMADADRFKSINDTYGHDVGDQALKQIAKAFHYSVPRHAIVGRLGGEEFGIFLPKATDVEAAAVCAAICAAVREHGKMIAGHDIGMTISVGGAIHADRKLLEMTMKTADQALYHAKHSGRDRFFIADAKGTMPELILKSSDIAA